MSAHFQGLYGEIQNRARSAPDPLVAAYHAIFDVKDAANAARRTGAQTEGTIHAAYEAAKALAVLLEATGRPVPQRFDAV